MRKLLAVAGALVGLAAGGGLGVPAAWACGGLVAPNGAVKLLQTTTFVAYHAGVERYMTSFQYEGGGSRFGSIIPLPAVPTSVTKGGGWTLQRLEREVNPPPPVAFNELASSAGTAGGAQVILSTQVDALEINVLRGGGPAVTEWVRQHGFAVSKDLPATLDFYAQRSPIFLTAVFDPASEARRGLRTGDGTPVQVAMPTKDPWVPLRILALAKDADDVVTADVFMLTDRRPALLSGPGVRLARSEAASPLLLSDLRSDRGMSWVPASGWLSYLKLAAPAEKLRYDLAADVSAYRQPSPLAAAVTLTRADLLRSGIPESPPGSDTAPIAVLSGLSLAGVLLGIAGWRSHRRSSVSGLNSRENPNATGHSRR